MSQYNGPASLPEIFQDIRQQLAALQNTKVTHGNGPPSAGATEPYVDDAAKRVYYRVAGAWWSSALT